jgi:hypothetical protein
MTYLLYALIYDEVCVEFSIKLRIKLRFRGENVSYISTGLDQVRVSAPSLDSMAALIRGVPHFRG